MIRRLESELVLNRLGCASAKREPRAAMSDVCVQISATGANPASVAHNYRFSGFAVVPCIAAYHLLRLRGSPLHGIEYPY